MKQKLGLPKRWRRGRRIAALLTLTILVCATFTLRKLGRADGLDNWWLRARFTFRELIQPVRPDPDIVLVSMDDICADEWKEPTIAWNPHMAKCVDRLRISGAKVIAFDWIQPEATSKWFPKNDEVLMEALTKTDKVVFASALRLDRKDTHLTLPYTLLRT